MLKINCWIAALWLISFSLRGVANQAIINSDGVLEIDGKKVFPIGFTVSPKPDSKTPSGRNAIDELADAGATFLRCGPLGMKWTEARFALEKQMEDAAAAHGMHCWLNLREASQIKKPQDEALLRKILTTFKDHPGLGCYKGEDEPEWGKAKIEPMAKAYKMVKEIDPNHPVVLIEAPRGSVATIKPYNPVCDIVGFDVYPIGYPPGMHSQFVQQNNTMSMIGDYTREAMEIAEGNKSVWMTLQISWSGVMKPGKTLRFPTFPEQRFMTYNAIINGARGVMYFGGSNERSMSEQDQHFGWNWRFWNRVLRAVVEEIGSKSPLYPALVAADSKLPVKVKGSGIEYCVHEVGNELFILACKSNQTTDECQFTGLPATVQVGDVLFEEPRKVEVKNGAFKDWFAPWEVHVYRFNR